MAKVIYHDLDRSAPRVTWLGVDFLDGVVVEVSNAEIIAKARRNRFFEVQEGGQPPAIGDEQKTTLADKARSLGVPVDGRWGVERLISEIEKLENEERARE